jgi:hypothetical protein
MDPLNRKSSYSPNEFFSAVKSAHRKHYIAESIAAFAASAFLALELTMEVLAATSLATPPISVIALSCLLVIAIAIAITCAVKARFAINESLPCIAEKDLDSPE